MKKMYIFKHNPYPLPLPHSLGLRTFALNSQTYNPLFEKKNPGSASDNDDILFYFFPVRFPTESRVLIDWRAVRFSPYGPRNRTAPLVEQVLSKRVFSFIFSKHLALIITLEMDNEGIHSESEFYLYPEKQDKYGLFVFFHSTRDITLSINVCYTCFMNWKFLSNKYVIHRPRSVRIGKNCALGLENVFIYFYFNKI